MRFRRSIATAGRQGQKVLNRNRSITVRRKSPLCAKSAQYAPGEEESFQYRIEQPTRNSDDPFLRLAGKGRKCSTGKGLHFLVNLYCTDEGINPETEPYAVLYIYIYFFSENTLGEGRINILIKKEERERRLEKGKMTTATQPGIEPGTSRFPGDCSTS